MRLMFDQSAKFGCLGSLRSCRDAGRLSPRRAIERRSRPVADIYRQVRLRNRGTPDRTFAARANKMDGWSVGVRTLLPLPLATGMTAFRSPVKNGRFRSERSPQPEAETLNALRRKARDRTTPSGHSSHRLRRRRTQKISAEARSPIAAAS